MLTQSPRPHLAASPFKRINRYWFRALFFILVCYAFRQKEVSINFGWQDPDTAPAALVTSTSVAIRGEDTAKHPQRQPTPAEGAEREQWLRKEAYIQEYKSIAQAEMQKHGIPASITLAQGLLESSAGRSSLAIKNRNHFGIKCFSKTCQPGHCSNFSDDSHKDFFRIYSSSAESYRAHSRLLGAARYRHLKNYDRTDYRRWAEGLQKAGYATDPSYASKLIQLIEAFELYYFDQE